MRHELHTTAILCELRLGSELSESNLRTLAAQAQSLKLDADTTIFREGDKHRSIYWLVDGRVTLDMSTGGGGTSTKLLLTLGRGDLLAWSALLGGCRMTAAAKTTEPTRLLAFDARQLSALCQSNHEIGYQVMEHLARQLASRLLATRLQLLDLFRHPSEPV